MSCRRSWVAPRLAFPLMAMLACGGDDTSPARPAMNVASVAPGNSVNTDPVTSSDPPEGTDPPSDGTPDGVQGEGTPDPELDPGTPPVGDGSGMMPAEDPPPPVAEVPGTFTKTVLHTQLGEPGSLAILPDGRVLHTARDGRLFLYQLDGTNSVAATIPVYSHDEDGLLGVALDPDFAAEPWVYLYYSPLLATPPGDAPLTGNADTFQEWAGVIRLSRFRFNGDTLDVESEQTILEVGTDRGICCHTGGNIDFDAAGNLYLSTGDDSNPFMSDGFAPIDERPDQNPALDAQRSAANTLDLRGKLLRIHVEDDGSYTTPEGNLFPRDTPGTRPEIYAMGLRNPYRFAVNRANGEVYVADYSPDAGQGNPARGPAATAKWLVVRGAANYGWPYCVGHLAYVDFDFATGESGQPFDCDRPRNESPRNTGLVDLPPVTDPELAYGYGPLPEFPALGRGGVAPMAGPMYVFDPASTSPIKWPQEYSGGIFFYEWSRDFIAKFQLADDGSLASMERLPAGVTADNPIDLKFGPDGALYMLEYGDGFYRANPDAQLSRIEYRVAP